MPISVPDAVAQILAQCQTGREEIGHALQRAFGAELEVSILEPSVLDAEQLPADLSGPGLAMAFAGSEGLGLFLLPRSSGLLPEWYAAADASQRSRLAALAEELGKSILPDSLAAAEFQYRAVPSLADVVRQSQPRDGAQAIELRLAKSPEAVARFVWPLDAAGLPPETIEAEARPAPRMRASHSASELPQYTRSLLHIRVPISVTLATKRQPIGQIMDLGAGSIIHFEKSCEEMLDLYVGEHRVAKGEAVKVGEKFGLRITSIILPEERFQPVNRR